MRPFGASLDCNTHTTQCDQMLTLSDLSGADPKIYNQITDMPKLVKVVEEYLEDYNSVSNAPMKVGFNFRGRGGFIYVFQPPLCISILVSHSPHAISSCSSLFRPFILFSFVHFSPCPCAM